MRINLIGSGTIQADAGRRQISGRVVTWDEDGNARQGRVRFPNGSLTFEANLQLRDQHESIGIGHPVELADNGPGVDGVFKVVDSPAGDAALLEAVAGRKTGFSVGVEVLDAHDDDGTLIVTAGRVYEVSVVDEPAIKSALITTVAAEAAPHASEEPPGAEEEPIEGEPMSETVEVDQAEETVEVVEASHPSPLIVAAARTQPRQVFASAGDFTKTLIAAERGDRAAARRIVEAAIVPADTSDAAGVVPPSMVKQIVDHIGDIRPLAGNVRNTAMTATGMKITKPKWGTQAAGGWAATENGEVATNTPTIPSYDVAVEQWAFAFGASLALVERSDPSYVDAVYSNAIKDYHADVEAKIATALLAITNTVVKGASHLESIGLAAADVFAGVKQAPNKAYIAPDIWADLVTEVGTLLIGTGSGSLGSTSGNILGLDLVVSPALTAGSIVVGVGNAYELRESAHIRLSANLIGTMTIEFGVSSFASFDLEEPLAFCKVVAA